MDPIRLDPAVRHVHVHGVRLEYVRLAPAQPSPGAPPMVFLHEGLGSISLWREFPRRVVDACGCPAIVYSRQGHGASDPATAARGHDYLHREAVDVLPALLVELGIERPLLFGHSDGATIALLCAGLTSTPVAGIVAAAPHVLVEDLTLEGIRRAVEAWRSTGLRARLARHHSESNLDPVFAAWHGTWLDPGFRDWNVEHALAGVRCPVLAIQGDQDEYATMSQFDRIVAALRDVRPLKLADCGHSPHRDQPGAVIDATRAFVRRIEQRSGGKAGGNAQ